jgi:deoxyadenosine/deoxycytidine kinase
MKKKLYIFIEGPIGLGKTTLVEYLKKLGYNTESEPVKHLQDNGLLEAFYKNPRKYGYLMQNTMFILKMEIINNIKSDIVFIERSPFCDKECFASLLHDDGFIDEIEWSSYNLWFNPLIKQMEQIDYKFIYLKAEPQICKERIENRGRKGEESISLEYLEKLSKKHDEWLNNMPQDKVLVLDASLDKEHIDEHIKKIEEFFHLGKI